jgi:hypothetical protein
MQILRDLGFSRPELAPCLQGSYQKAINMVSINKGNIYLNPNPDDLELVTIWRSITLPNVCYKTLAKALALRVNRKP